MDPIMIAGVAAPVVLLLVAVPLILVRTRRAVPEGKALVVHKQGKTTISLEDARVWPFIHRTELIDISLQRVDVACVGKSSLSCRDRLRADVEASFFLRINNMPEDILKVYKTIGATRAADRAEVAALFEPKCREAMATIFAQVDLSDAIERREDIRDQILMIIGQDLNGFQLEDVAISRIGMTPLEFMDPQNIFDAEGIRKLTDRTAMEAAQVHKLKLEQANRAAELDREAAQIALNFERDAAEARARMEKEIALVKLQQETEVERARVDAEREVAIHNIHKDKTLALQQLDKDKSLALHKIELDRGLGLPDIALED